MTPDDIQYRARILRVTSGAGESVSFFFIRRENRISCMDASSTQ